MSIPQELRYTKNHEWIRRDGDLLAIGITHHAQESLGDIVFVELPELGRELNAGDTFGVVESVKAVSDLFAPIGGTVEEINEPLADAPETVNHDPYQGGWMIKIKPADASVLSSLMDAAAYTELVAQESK